MAKAPAGAPALSRSQILTALSEEITASLSVAQAALDAGFVASPYDPNLFEEALGAMERAETSISRYKAISKGSS